MRKVCFTCCVAALLAGALLTNVSHAQRLDFPELDRGSLEKIPERDQFKYLQTPDAVQLSRKKTRDLMDAVFQTSPTVRQAEFSFESSLSDKQAAQGAKLHQVFGTVQSNFTEGELASAAKATGKPSYTLAGQLVLYDWGRLDALVQNRNALADAAQSRIDVARLDLTIEVISACLELNKQTALFGAAKTYTRKIEDLTSRISKVAESDPGRSSELLQTQSRVLQAKSSEKITESKIREISLRLQKHIPGDVPAACEGIGASLLEAAQESDITNKTDYHPQLHVLDAQYRAELETQRQLQATLKPQVSVRAEHTPLAPGLRTDYQQSIAFQATAILFDGNTLKSNAAAAQQRAYATSEQRERFSRQLRSDLLEKNKLASTLLTRAEEYVSLLEVNQRVRDDFFIQWAALGRRTLFELLAIEAEQFSLRSGYYTSLYDAMINYANVRANLGLISE